MIYQKNEKTKKNKDIQNKNSFIIKPPRIKEFPKPRLLNKKNDKYDMSSSLFIVKNYYIYTKPFFLL